jgi:drug/metabolite transporter (DMT)-like permease
MMYTAELSALAAALCWSFGGLLATNPARLLGAVPFNRIRMAMVFVMLSLMAILTGGWYSLTPNYSTVLAVSALIGIFIGDTSFYESMRRLGPRRTGILFATNAPMTAILGYSLLDERLPTNTMIGCALIMTGVGLAVFFGAAARQRHAFEEVRGRLGIGIGFGLFAAFCQAISLIIARPVLASGVDVVSASALRVGTAALALTALLLFRSRTVRSSAPLTPRLVGQVALSGLVGMGLGMTFLLHALAHGPAGLVSTLSATSPVLILPVLWVATKERPAPGAWIGAFLAVLGAACIFNS